MQESLTNNSAQYLVDYYRLKGLSVIKTEHCWWYNEYGQNRLYFSFPLHRLIAPDFNELNSIFSPKGPFAVHYSAPLGNPGEESYRWVRRRPYDMLEINKKPRNQVRRGLDNCQIRRLTFDELCSSAHEANQDTLERHGEGARSLGINKELDECAAYEAWGAFVKERLAAYLVTFWVEDWAHILINRSANASLKYYPNNALVFSVTQQLLSRDEISTVSYGLKSLDRSLETLDHFKAEMGFIKEPIIRCIVLAPWIKPFLNPVTCRLFESFGLLFPRHHRVQRLAGFCRIVRESNK